LNANRQMTNTERAGQMITRSTRRAIYVCLLSAVSAAAWCAPSQRPAILFDPTTQQNTPLPDFSYAGYAFGLQPLPRAFGQVINVVDYGAVANDELDDSKAVLAALAAANKVTGKVTLRFPAGRFILSEVLLIERSNFVLEGAGRGAGGTQLYFPHPLKLADKSNRLDKVRAYLLENKKRQVEPLYNLDEPFSEYSWSGGFVWVRAPDETAYMFKTKQKKTALAVIGGRQGQFDLQMRSSHHYKIGDVISVSWYPRDGKSSAILRSMFGDMASSAGARLWEEPERPIVVQTTLVTAVNGGMVTIADPLMHDINQAQPANVEPWHGLTQVGIRDLAFMFPPGRSFGHHVEQGWNAVYINNVFNGWVESLRVHNGDSGVLTYDSASLTIKDVLTDGKREAHYSVHLGDVHNVLASNIQVENKVVHSLSFNTLCTRSVYQNSTVRQASVLDQHAGANQQNLFDNITLYIRPTIINGSPSYPLWNGSGAAYWQPGHGRFNTNWNLHVLVESGARPDEVVNLTGLEEGPDARIVGLSGNRTFTLEYVPQPYVEMLNERAENVPSLYEWQRAQRLQKH
jgi:Pectate lyase superfamily protein